MVNVNKCFGHPDSKRYCARCRYLKSCRYYQSTESSVDSHLGMVNYGVLADWYEGAADCEHIPGCGEPETGKREFTVMIGEFFRYMLELDDYTLALISELITPGDPDRHSGTIAALAGLRHTSRQALHRKICRIIGAHPELAEFFRLLLRRLSRCRLPRRTTAKQPEQATA